MPEMFLKRASATDVASTAPPAGAAGAEGLDLLRIGAVRSLVRWAGFPDLLQIAMLIVFIGLAVASWGVFSPEGANAKLFAKANLATLLIWGLWWPVMIWTAVLFGRVWCAVCPLEWVSAVCESTGRRMGFLQRPLRRWIVSGTIIVALYALIQLLVAGAHIHRVPAYTSYFLIGLLGLAAITGFFFKGRAFCRGFCPVGVILNIYGRGGMVAVRPGATEAGHGTPVDAHTCPSLLNPSKLASNANCLVCGHCLKTAAPGQMRLLLRPPFPTNGARKIAASWPITVFVMLVSGFVIGELFTEWADGNKVFLAVPMWGAARVGASAHAGWFEGVWALGVVPLVLWSALGGILWAFGHRQRIGGLWRQMALPMAVIVAAGHMSKGLAKLVSWAPFVPGALQDPDGIATAQAISSRAITAPAPWLSVVAVAMIAVALIAAAFVFAVREFRLARGAHAFHASAAVPLALVAIGFVGIVVGWPYR
ncbi:MAG: 4Fe-4S binding protein [Opitutus sp.]